MLRILLPLFPWSPARFATVLLVLGVVSVVYGAFVAMAQTDLKKLIAYCSVSHMGYVMMGVAAAAALQPEHGIGATPSQVLAAQTAVAGAVYVMIAHGIITGALFLLVGVIYDRTHTRDLAAFGGLGAQMPAYSGMFRLAMFASLGLPGLAGFIGEFMVVRGHVSDLPARHSNRRAGLDRDRSVPALDDPAGAASARSIHAGHHYPTWTGASGWCWHRWRC